MRRFCGLLLALVLLLMSSCGATLRLTATAPAQVNDGTCEAPVLYPAVPGSEMFLHFSWSGPVSGEDSVSTQPGRLESFARVVPPGTYTVSAWASNAGGAGCDTVVTKQVVAPPASPIVR